VFKCAPARTMIHSKVQLLSSIIYLASWNLSCQRWCITTYSIVKKDAKLVSMLKRILPTKITTTKTTMMVRKTKRPDLNLLLKARSSRYGKGYRYPSTCTVHVGQHIHYTIVSVAGRYASDTPKCGGLILFPKGQK